MGAEQKQQGDDRAWLAEQRYRAVLEVLDGSPVSEVAVRYGVSRQSVYSWKARHAAAGIDGLREASRRPRTCPARLPAGVEALVCELRRAHPRWGARRIAFEVAQRGVTPAPPRATVHRVLARNGMVTPQAQRHKRKYRRWQRETPMALWQLDLVGGIYLADGRECKLLSGIDDHSRFVVCAAVLAVPSGRAVADAFTAAMRRYGVPAEVLTDNGKQFTGRFTKPRPAEVLFGRVCREHGITAKLTRPYSPATTGKVERWHRTLRRELLDVTGPFADLPSAQAAIGAWVHACNHQRPHQAIDMATPARLFRPGHQPELTPAAAVPPPRPAPDADGEPAGQARC
jgi:transposase InsO family protein